MTYDPIDTSATDNAADGSVTTATLDSTTVDNSGTVTTQDIVVNGTATGPFGGVTLEQDSGTFGFSSITTTRTINVSSCDALMATVGAKIGGNANNNDYTASYIESISPSQGSFIAEVNTQHNQGGTAFWHAVMITKG